MFGKIGELFVRVGMDGTDKVKSGMGQIGSVTEATAEKLHRAGGVFQWFGGMAQKGFDVAKNAAVGFGIAAAATVGVVGKEAATASISYANLEARLEAVTGAADIAGRKLKYVQDVAGPSNFTFRELAEATTTLEAFGINAERVLPTVARLGMAFGAGNDQLQMLVRGLGDISAGGFLEKDVAASFGLNRSMFEAKGIKFDGGGQLLSSAQDTMAALEQIVNERYGNIFEKIGKTPGAKLASLQDTWEKTLRVMGDSVMQRLAPGIDYTSNLLDGLVNSSLLSKFLDGFGAGLDRLWTKVTGGTDVFDGFTRVVAGTMSVIEKLPDAAGMLFDYLPKLWDAAKTDVIGFGTFLGDTFQTGWNNALKVTEWAVGRMGSMLDNTVMAAKDTAKQLWETLTGPATSFIELLQKPSAEAAAKFRDKTTNFFNAPYDPLAQPMGSFTKNMMARSGGYTAPFPQLEKFPEFMKNRDGSDRFKELPALPNFGLLDNYQRNAELLQQGIKDAAGRDMGVPQPRGDFFTREMEDKDGGAAKQLLSGIEENTRKAADALSLRRQTLGGGPLGALGITPAEYSAGARAPEYRPGPARVERIPQPRANVRGLSEAVARGMIEVVNKRMGELSNMGPDYYGFRPRN